MQIQLSAHEEELKALEARHANEYDLIKQQMSELMVTLITTETMFKKEKYAKEESYEVCLTTHDHVSVSQLATAQKNILVIY